MEETMERLRARVCRVQPGLMQVCRLDGGDCILVHTPCACCYRPGDCVSICYNGMMTRSIPPQISAICVERISGCGGNSCECE